MKKTTETTERYRVGLTDDIAQDTGNSITVTKEGSDVFLTIKVKIKQSRPHADEDRGDVAGELARERAKQNFRELPAGVLSILNASANKQSISLELRKRHLSNSPGNCKMVMTAEVDPKVPHTGAGLKPKVEKEL